MSVIEQIFEDIRHHTSLILAFVKNNVGDTSRLVLKQRVTARDSLIMHAVITLVWQEKWDDINSLKECRMSFLGINPISRPKYSNKLFCKIECHDDGNC